MKPYDHRIFVLLDSFSPRAIKKWIKFHNKVIDYTSEHFAFFAQRRSRMMDELKSSLQENATSFEFSDWVRIVSQEFSNHPLSTVGSFLHFPGGRFNIGTIDEQQFPRFPALYLASDSTTAFLEAHGLEANVSTDGISGAELAVAGNFAHFKIKGKLTNILDLTNPNSLLYFYNHIKGIKLPFYYTKKANELKTNAMLPVKNLTELLNTIFAENWRLMPMQFDTPSNSQILGQIASAAGLEGILYPSVKTNKNSLVLYPQNFHASEAFVEIKGNVAETVKNTRIDRLTYKNYLPTKFYNAK